MESLQSRQGNQLAAFIPKQKISRQKPSSRFTKNDIFLTFGLGMRRNGGNCLMALFLAE